MGLGLCGMRVSRSLPLRAHFRSRGDHHRCIHYNAVSPHEDWMHPPSLDAASDGRRADDCSRMEGRRRRRLRRWMGFMGWKDVGNQPGLLLRGTEGRREGGIGSAVNAEVAVAVRSHDRLPMGGGGGRHGLRGEKNPQFV